MPDIHIGRRLRELRERERLNQATMAEVLQLKAPQSVSQIENGQRRVTTDELLRVMKRFEVSLDWLTNPFRLSNRDSFSWRQRQVDPEVLREFEAKTGEWIGAYRELSRLNETPLRALLPRLGLTYTSHWQDAADAGEQVAEELMLGDRPAYRLAEVLQETLGILILMVDAPEGVSGAACRLQALNAILVNRHDPEARRNSDIAHELFHLLTWDVMKPEHVESSLEAWEEKPVTRADKRNLSIERLADNFGAGLLMPRAALDLIGEPEHDNLVQWLTDAAALLGVSSRTLKWRLVNTGRLQREDAPDNEDLAVLARARPPCTPPTLFSKPFMDVIAKAIEAGHLSGNRAASLLGMPKTSIGDLCDVYGTQRPVEL